LKIDLNSYDLESFLNSKVVVTFFFIIKTPENYYIFMLRLYGSYEALAYGNLDEAVVDLTGAMSERIKIEPHKKDFYWNLLTFAYRKEAIIGSAIHREAGQQMEHKLSNGLVLGHQYTVTRVAVVKVDGKSIRLIRLR
jgi:hypothetical protein